MDAQDETNEKSLAKKERVKQNENEIWVPRNSNYADYVIFEREERVREQEERSHMHD
jgi:hypothetical protein